MNLNPPSHWALAEALRLIRGLNGESPWTIMTSGTWVRASGRRQDGLEWCI
jgi:hypothetical protein